MPGDWQEEDLRLALNEAERSMERQLRDKNKSRVCYTQEEAWGVNSNGRTYSLEETEVDRANRQLREMAELAAKTREQEMENRRQHHSFAAKVPGKFKRRPR